MTFVPDPFILDDWSVGPHFYDGGTRDRIAQYTVHGTNYEGVGVLAVFIPR